MSLRIDSRVFEKYPGLLVGTIVCRDLSNGPAPPELTAELREAERALRARFPDAEALKAHSNVVAWQAAHRSFGSNPNKFPPSMHALAKRVVNGRELPAISALVDAYNIVSLRHLLPIGGEDLARCRGEIILTFAEGGEAFTPLGEDESAPPDAGEVIYRDNEGVLCRKFNWREAARTCLTGSTTEAVLVIEALPPVIRGELEAALAELRALAGRFCGEGCRMTTLIHTNEGGS